MIREYYNRLKQKMKKHLYTFRMDDTSRVLVIAPHPDDESIGMGGFLYKYKSNCDVILVTNGACGNPEWSKEKTIEVRRREFQDAMQFIGIEKYYMLDVMDQEAKYNLHVLKEYLNNEYDYIFVPNRHDIHPDHSCLHKYVSRYNRIKKTKSTIVEYEVWTPLVRPNFFLDISGFYKEKEYAIQRHESQVKHVKYDWGSLGLNMYRGMLSGSLYAEAYYVNKPMLGRILDKLKKIKDNFEKSQESRV